MEALKLSESQVFGLVLGKVISGMREQQRWTQAVLAFRAGISQPVLSRIEAGRMPDAFVYGRLAAAFGLTVQQLDERVHQAMNRTKRAAEAVASPPQQWEHVVSAVGKIGLVGLIIFAVAALLSDEGGGGTPPVK